MHEPEGWVHCDVKKSQDKCIDFWHLHVNKFISVINLIHTRHKIIVNNKATKNNCRNGETRPTQKKPPTPRFFFFVHGPMQTANWTTGLHIFISLINRIETSHLMIVYNNAKIKIIVLE